MKFDKEQALARYIELWEKRGAEFDQLPGIERRVARGEYDFISSVDIELDELEREAMRNGFALENNFDVDKDEFVYTCEPMSPEDYAAFLAEEQEE
jgi:hypothetical protein